MPPVFKEGVLDYVDLEIDALVESDFSYKILDVDEFNANSIKFAYPAEVVLNAERAFERSLIKYW